VRAVMTARTGRLGLVRVLFGTLVLLRTTPVLAPLHVPYLRATSPLLGWPSSTWHVPMWGPALPAGLVATFCVARTLAIVLFTLGVHARESGVASGILAWAVMTQNAGSYINTFHLLFLGLIVLGVSGAGSTLAWRRELEVDPRSGLALTRAFVASVYAWSGFAKLNLSWLQGDVLQRLHADGVVHGPIADALLAMTPGCTVAAWTVVGTELALGPLLLWPRTRSLAWVAALTFHAVLELSLHPDFFGFGMSVLLLAFVETGGARHCAVDMYGGGGAVGSLSTQAPDRQTPEQ
jgi:hypothetical protein